MIKVGDTVELLQDVEFDYGTVAKKGDRSEVYKIDEEGYWLKKFEIYISPEEVKNFLKKVG